VIRPSSVTLIACAAGKAGSPGIVRISPQTMTTNRAPAASLTSRTVSTCP
jgi:hypothetical protein